MTNHSLNEIECIKIFYFISHPKNKFEMHKQTSKSDNKIANSSHKILSLCHHLHNLQIRIKMMNHSIFLSNNPTYFLSIQFPNDILVEQGKVISNTRSKVHWKTQNIISCCDKRLKYRKLPEYNLWGL